MKVESETTSTPQQFSTNNPLGVKGFDHIEFIVDDAEAWRDYYIERFGMTLRSQGDESTGLEGRKAYMVGQGRINFLIAQPQGSGPMFEEYQAHFEKHGNGVKDVAFLVEDSKAAVDEAVRRGAKQICEERRDEEAGYISNVIAAYGDTVHSFIERKERSSIYIPGMQETEESKNETEINFAMIDHVVANVEVMDEWVDFYEKVFGFEPTRHFDINTGRSALMSKVMGSNDGYIKMPINEPSSGNSQIQEYLDEYNGPGVQHIALLTPDIVKTIEAMRAKGMEFLDINDSYYDEHFEKRMGQIDEDLEDLHRNQILADKDEGEKGYLLQIFTRCIFERPTVFHEVIQRKGGAKGFGEGNFKALFESIEREQARRGTL